MFLFGSISEFWAYDVLTYEHCKDLALCELKVNVISLSHSCPQLWLPKNKVGLPDGFKANIEKHCSKTFSTHLFFCIYLTDVSRNRLIEVPHEVCEYLYVARLNCYHNVIRSIPEAIRQLQNLTHLNLR